MKSRTKPARSATAEIRPPASGLRPPESCRNCGTELSDEFCPHCGQKRDAGKGVPLFHLIGGFLSNAWALDGRVPHTLATLFWRPGRLSIDYREGRIVRYASPVQLFWLSTLLIVALTVAVLSTAEQQGVLDEAFEQIHVDSLGHTPQVDSFSIQLFDATTRLTHKEIMTILRDATAKYTAYISVAMIPFLALLLYLFYWRRRDRIYYMYHMIFALHFNAFINLLVAPIFLWNVLFPKVVVAGWVETLASLVYLLPGVYLVVASKRFYAPQRWRWVILKTLALTFIYFVATFIIVGAVIAVVVHTR